MSDVKLCDACGAIFEQYSTRAYETPAIKFKRIKTVGGGRENYFDACPACALKLAIFFNIISHEPNGDFGGETAREGLKEATEVGDE